jgi:murein L,D-transpeptidase YafK
VAYPPKRLFLRAFKKERLLEVWAGNAKGTLALVKAYPICALSGELGPKRQQGDLQIPEGVYVIDRFNTTSSFYLSLGVSYPNASDRILGAKGRLGGDIFIHGDCVTIGCLPLTDELIKEVYVIALDTFIAGEREIPVHIFPLRMDEAGLKELESIAGDDAVLRAFWQGLAPIYARFESSHMVPGVTVDPKSGAYRLPP